MATPASQDLYAKFEVGQDSANLFGKFIVRQAESRDLFAKFIVNASADLFAKFICRNIADRDLLGKFAVRHAASQNLFAKFIVRDTAMENLFAKAVIRNIGSANLFAKFEVNDSEDLFGKFIVRIADSQNLFGKFIVRQAASADLFGKFIVRHAASVNLFCNFEVGQGWVDLKARAIVRQANPLVVWEDIFAYWAAYRAGVGTYTVAISQEAVQKHIGQYSLEMLVTQPGGGNFADVGAYVQWPTGQKWDIYDLIRLWWFGSNTGETIRMYMYSTAGNWKEFWFTDNFNGWKRIDKPLQAAGDASGGAINMASITYFRVYISAISSSATWYVDQISISQADLYAKFDVNAVVDLFAKFIVRQTGSANLFAKFVVRLASSANLFGKFVVRQPGSANLFAKLSVRHAGSTNLFAKFVCRNVGSANLFGTFIVRHASWATGPYCKFIINAVADLYCKVEVQDREDLYAKFIVSRRDHLEQGITFMEYELLKKTIAVRVV